ncbi:MAG TPA: ribonuclease HII [Clostridia bacterium]|nr:ribonuclease HII [Clostridia bacterium]
MDWHQHENEAFAQGFTTVCGIDEAGRGPLAGPVCAAAVILPKGCEIEGLNDSKKLSEKKRNALFDIITEKSLAYSIAWATATEVDQINVLQATFLAMERAVDGLSLQADMALVDGNQMPPLPLPTRTIIRGDAVSASIAAASVLAKVSRDRFMVELDRQYPEYRFAAHKGYGTKAHYEMLALYGPSPMHRQTFLKNIDRAK